MVGERLRPIGAPAVAAGPVPSTSITGLSSQQVMFGSPTGGIAQNSSFFFDGTNLTAPSLSLRGPALLTTGTTSLPSIGLIASSNTGINFPTTNRITLNIAGTEQVTINSSGQVGIGTTTPSRALDVAAGTQTSVLNVIAGATFGAQVNGTSAALTGGLTASSAVISNNLQSSVLNVIAGATFGAQINGTSASLSGGISASSGIFSANVQSSVLNVIAGATFGGVIDGTSILLTGGISATSALFSANVHTSQLLVDGTAQSSVFLAAAGTTSTPSYGNVGGGAGFNVYSSQTVSIVAGSKDGAWITSATFGLGTTAPVAQLHIGNGAFFYDRFAVTPVIAMRYANGSIGSPTSVLSGDVIGQWDVRPWNGDAYTSPLVVMRLVAGANITTVNYAFNYQFANCAAGTTVNSVRLQIVDRSVIIGGSTADAVGFFGTSGSSQAPAYTKSASTVTRTIPTTISTVIGAYSSAVIVGIANAVNALISIANNHIGDMQAYNLLR